MRVVTCAIVLLLLVPSASQAEVVVIDEEVIFSIVAPGASEVFLVGDFNNWNATLEKMDQAGDRFQIGLFLVPGRYRYQFMVDGVPKNDPDNPVTSPERGSVIALVMRGGVLVLGEEEPLQPGGGLAGIEPSLRYTGAFIDDNYRSIPDQTVDLFLNYETERLRARVNLKTSDDTWRGSPLTTEIRLNDGYVHIHFDNADILGFENQEMWSSSDPFSLVGDVGIYDYNAGLGRKGGALVIGTNSRVSFKAMYADRSADVLPAPVRIAAADLADFAGSGAADTTVYAYRPTYEDEDTWAFDLAGDFGGFDIGFASRRYRGYQPGIIADITRGSGDFSIDAHSVREYWVGGVTWFAWEFVRHLTFEGALGYSDTEFKQLLQTQSTVTTLGDIAAGQDATPEDSNVNAQTSDRWRAGLVYARDNWEVGVGGEWIDNDFDVPMRTAADAGLLTLHGSWDDDDWHATVSAGYLDQRYESAPDDFHLHTQNRNRWLDYEDDLTPTHLAMFDLSSASEVHIAAEWDGVDSTAVWGGMMLSSTLDLAAKDMLTSIEYLAWRLGGEYRLPRQLYAQLDGRLARYDKPLWNVKNTFLAAYAEVGFRNRYIEISIGAGIDPVVLNPVTNYYQDIGREEFIRQALPPVVLRSQAAALGAAVAEQERKLEDIYPIKLEAIISF